MTRVLIVGAGPTGMTLALALKQRGIAHRLIERLPQRAPHSRALAVQARTLEVFEQLGLVERFLAEGVAIDGITLHHGDHATRIDFTHVHPRLPSAIILPQDETERLLEAAGASPERGVSFVDLVDGGARLCLADGTEDIVQADWVVGCDGAHSAVRHALGTGFPGSRYETKLVLADCRVAELHEPRVNAWPSAARPGGAFPLPNGLWRIIALLPEDAPDPGEGSLAPFAHLPLTLSDPVWWSRFNISQRQVASMRSGRVLLCGDAAHIHSPAGGQGMNLGIQDAWPLARAIESGEAAVDAWATERHSVAAKVLKATDRTTRLMLATSRPLAAVAVRLLGVALRNGWVERRMERAFAGLEYPPVS